MYNCIFYFSIYLQNKTIKNNIIYFHKICFIILIYIYLCFCEFVSWFFLKKYIYIYISKQFISKNFYVYYQEKCFREYFYYQRNHSNFIFLTTKTIWNPKITKNEKWWKVMKSDDFITFHHFSFFVFFDKKCLNKIIHPREVHS